MKKAFMISFKFILSIIIGAIILVFFINFAFQHAKTSEKLSAVELVNYLDLKLEILSNTQNANTEFTFPDKKNIDIICNRILLTYKDDSYSTTTDKIIASPVQLKENNIKIWTKSWLFPFKVTNFYYIANDKVNFYIEDAYLSQELPKIFTQSAVSELKEDSVAIFSSEPSNLQELLGKNIKVRQILDDNSIIFYPEGKIGNYYGEEMLFLAIFSRDYNTYECLRKRIFSELKRISEIYRQESILLKTKAKQECSYIYDQLSSSLNTLPEDLNSDQIETLNEELDYNACPTIY